MKGLLFTDIIVCIHDNNFQRSTLTWSLIVHTKLVHGNRNLFSALQWGLSEAGNLTAIALLNYC